MSGWTDSPTPSSSNNSVPTAFTTKATREEERAIAGIRSLLPRNFHSKVWIDDEDEARFMPEREFMLTPPI